MTGLEEAIFRIVTRLLAQYGAGKLFEALPDREVEVPESYARFDTESAPALDPAARDRVIGTLGALDVTIAHHPAHRYGLTLLVLAALAMIVAGLWGMGMLLASGAVKGTLARVTGMIAAMLGALVGGLLFMGGRAIVRAWEYSRLLRPAAVKIMRDERITHQQLVAVLEETDTPQLLGFMGALCKDPVLTRFG